MTAGFTTLSIINEDPEFYTKLNAKSQALVDGIGRKLGDLGLSLTTNRVGSMFTMFFTDAPVRNWDDAVRCSKTQYAAYFTEMLNRGIYLAPSQFEAAFIGIMHSDEDIERTIQASGESLRAVFHQ